MFGLFLNWWLGADTHVYGSHVPGTGAQIRLQETHWGLTVSLESDIHWQDWTSCSSWTSDRYKYYRFISNFNYHMFISPTCAHSPLWCYACAAGDGPGELPTAWRVLCTHSSSLLVPRLWPVQTGSTEDSETGGSNVFRPKDQTRAALYIILPCDINNFNGRSLSLSYGHHMQGLSAPVRHFIKIIFWMKHQQHPLFLFWF